VKIKEQEGHILKMKGELKRLRHDLIMGTKTGNYVDEDEDLQPEELEAFKALNPEVRRLISDLVQAQCND